MLHYSPIYYPISRLNQLKLCSYVTVLYPLRHVIQFDSHHISLLSTSSQGGVLNFIAYTMYGTLNN